MTLITDITATSPENYWKMDDAALSLSCAAAVGTPTLTLGTSTAAPTLGNTGQSGNCAHFDGSNDFMQSSASLALSSFKKIGVGFLLKVTSFTDADRTTLEYGSGGSGDGFAFFPDSSNNIVGVLGTCIVRNSSGGNSNYTRWARPVIAQWNFFYLIFDRTLSGAVQENSLYVNGVLRNKFADRSPENDLSANFFNNAVLNVMCTNGSSNFMAGDMQHLFINGGSNVPNAATISALSVSAGLTVRYPTVLPPTTAIHGNGRSFTADTKYVQSQLAVGDFVTDAASLELSVYTNCSSSSNKKMGLQIDGVVQSVIDMSALTNGMRTVNVTLGTAGTERKVKITGGVADQTVSVGTPFNVAIVDVAAVGGTYIKTSPVNTANKILVYGDSITIGYGTTERTTNAWTTIMRRTYGFNIVVEAADGRALCDDVGTSPGSHTSTSDGTKNTNFTAVLGAFGVKHIVICVSSNDYGHNEWTAANFGTAYDLFLTNLHTQYPNATIYCMSALTRNSTDESTANGNGDLPSAYRTQVSTKAALHAYCVYVDGTTILSNPTDFQADGLHPSDAGQAKMALFFAQLLPKSGVLPRVKRSWR